MDSSPEGRVFDETSSDWNCADRDRRVRQGRPTPRPLHPQTWAARRSPRTRAPTLLGVRPDQYQLGFKQKLWPVHFDASSIPDGSFLNVSTCVAFFDSNIKFRNETCTDGSDRQRLQLHAGHRRSHPCQRQGIRHPHRNVLVRCNANMFRSGSAEPAAPISVKATWTGQGPITYSSNIGYIPGVYRMVQRSKFRNAVASGTSTAKRPQASLPTASSRLRSRRRGQSCGTASGGVRTERVLTIPPQAPKCRSGARQGLR